MFLNEKMSVLHLPTILFYLNMNISTFAEWSFTVLDTEMMSLAMFLLCSYILSQFEPQCFYMRVLLKINALLAQTSVRQY